MAKQCWNVIILLLLPLSFLTAERNAASFRRARQPDSLLLEQVLRNLDKLPQDLLDNDDSISLSDRKKTGLHISLSDESDAPNSTHSSNLPGKSAETTEMADGEEGYLINFNNLNIVEVLRFVSRISSKNFIFDQEELDFTVTIVSEEPTSSQNVMAALLQVLKINGLRVFQQDNNYLIHSNPTITAPSAEIFGLDAEKKQRIVNGELVGADRGDSESVSGYQRQINLSLEREKDLTNRRRELEQQGENEAAKELAKQIRREQQQRRRLSQRQKAVASREQAPIDKNVLVTRVFVLERVPASSLSSVLGSMTSGDALIQTLDETNHLIVTDLAGHVAKVASFIRSVDGPGGQLDVGQYVSRNTHIGPLIELSRSILEPLAQNDPIQLIAHPPTASIFIISTPYMVERAMSIFQVLDMTDSESRVLSLKDLSYDPFMENEITEILDLSGKRWEGGLAPGDAGSTKLEFYKLQYRNSDSLEAAITSVGESASGASSLSPDILAAIDSVTSIPESNMLVFTGAPLAVKAIHGFIKKLDTPLQQVFIEMLILDTSIDKSLEFGVEWGGRYTGSSVGAGSMGFLGASSLHEAALDGLGAAAPKAIENVEGFSVGALGRLITLGSGSYASLSALLKAVQTQKDINVVMNPKIITEDNSPAEVFVGQTNRFKTESVANESGDLITSNFEFREVGSTMRVTPLVGGDDMITLIIEQTVSNTLADKAADAVTNAELGPVTTNARTTTRVHVPNKQFLILSGMIQETRTRQKTSVPCLGGIPVLGAAFSRNTYVSNKRNLMIFIRPQIINSERDIKELTKNQRKMFENKSKPKKTWKYELNAGLDILNLKRANMMDDDWEP
jgi:type II secretion system protein D